MKDEVVVVENYETMPKDSRRHGRLEDHHGHLFSPIRLDSPIHSFIHLFLAMLFIAIRGSTCNNFSSKVYLSQIRTWVTTGNNTQPHLHHTTSAY